MTPLYHTLGKRPGKSRSHGAGSEAPPPVVGNEPVFTGLSQTLIYQDDMTKYTSAHEMYLDRLDGTTRFGQTPPPGEGPGEEPGVDLLLAPGRNGVTGQMISIIYQGQPPAPGVQEVHAWYLYGMPELPTTTTHVWQYWFKCQLTTPLTLNTDDGNDVLSLKFFEAFHLVVDRIQWNTHDYLPGPVSYPPPGGTRIANCMWESLDVGNDTGQHQPVEPSARTVFNSGQWWRITHRYRSNSTAGARDGFSQMWVGQGPLGTATKVIDISEAQIGITPPGGWKVWCTGTDVDAIANADQSGPISGPIHLGSVLTSQTQGPFQFFWTEFLWWKEN